MESKKDDRIRFQLSPELFSTAQRLTGKKNQTEVIAALVQSFGQTGNGNGNGTSHVPYGLITLQEREYREHWRTVEIESKARLVRAKAANAEVNLRQRIEKEDLKPLQGSGPHLWCFNHQTYESAASRCFSENYLPLPTLAQLAQDTQADPDVGQRES